MKGIKVEAKTRNELRTLAQAVRAKLGYTQDDAINPLALLETLHFWDPDAHFEVVEASELRSKDHAVTDIVHKTIKIRSDVYDGACNGNGRDRMTLVHEFSHFLMLNILGFKLARSFDSNLPAYEDPEWQAKCLAGELMMPADKIRGMTIKEIVSHYGVSPDAALMQKKHSF